jgi:hypothetical protein
MSKVSNAQGGSFGAERHVCTVPARHALLQGTCWIRPYIYLMASRTDMAGQLQQGVMKPTLQKFPGNVAHRLEYLLRSPWLQMNSHRVVISAKTMA